MITKGKFYLILSLVVLLSAITILMLRKHYKMNSQPALMVNTIWQSQSIKHSQEVYAKLNDQICKRLLQVADETTQKHLTELNDRTKSIIDILFSVREQLISITGGIDPIGMLVGIENREICTDYLFKQGHGEKVKQQIDAYVRYIKSMKVDALSPMPSPQEVQDLTNYYHGLKKEWFVGNSYSEFMIQDLTLAQCLLHFDWVAKEIYTLEMRTLQKIEKDMLEKGVLQGEAYF